MLIKNVNKEKAAQLDTADLNEQSIRVTKLLPMDSMIYIPNMLPAVYEGRGYSVRLIEWLPTRLRLSLPTQMF